MVVSNQLSTNLCKVNILQTTSLTFSLEPSFLGCSTALGIQMKVNYKVGIMEEFIFIIRNLALVSPFTIKTAFERDIDKSFWILLSSSQMSMA